jgi:hypothetical protein
MILTIMWYQGRKLLVVLHDVKNIGDKSEAPRRLFELELLLGIALTTKSGSFVNHVNPTMSGRRMSSVLVT